MLGLELKDGADVEEPVALPIDAPDAEADGVATVEARGVDTLFV